MNAYKEIARLPRAAWLLAAVILVNRMGTMAVPFLALYLTRSLHFSPEAIGAIFATYGVGSLVASPYAGRLSDRVGPVRVMLASLTGSGLTLVLFPLAKTEIAVAAFALALALTTEAFRPASQSLVRDVTPKAQQKQAFALTRLAVNVGMSLGPALGGVLATAWFPLLFLIDGATSLLAAGLIALTMRGLFRRPPEEPEASVQDAPNGPRVSPLRDARFVAFLVGVFLVGLVFFQIDGALPIHLVQNLHFTEATFGALCAVNTVLVLLFEVPLAALTSRWQNRSSLVLGALLTGSGFGSLACATGLAAVVIAVVIFTFGEMILMPALSAHVAAVAPPRRGGEYMGVYGTAFSLAFLAGPGLGAILVARSGGAVVWIASGVCCALAALTMRAVVKREKGEAASP